MEASEEKDEKQNKKMKMRQRIYFAVVWMASKKPKVKILTIISALK